MEKNINKEKVAIVIPVYKEQLSAYEEASLKQLVSVLSKYRLILAAPTGLKLDEYFKYYDFDVQLFDAKYFKSTKTYNKLLMNSFFYKKFLFANYILIYQLDAFVFQDNLEDWCQKNLTYVGAPWIDGEWITILSEKWKFPFHKVINKVGNGGLSLRKTKPFYLLSLVFKPVTFFWAFNEDIFWSTFVSILPGFKVASMSDAIFFAFEDNPSKCYQLTNSTLPFGCHAWEKYDIDFWKPIFEKEGYVI